MKVVLGFSGGVDSAVCAALLKKDGYEVHGLYMDNADENSKNDAISAAEFIGIPLTIVDVKEQLEEKVCRPFMEAYLRGETPNPCIICNPSVKFKVLIEHADKIGAEFVATGHYARAEGGHIYKGHPSNDQSYMLCRLTGAQAKRVMFPIGGFAKEEVREMARELNLPVANKPDSMEICFIPDKNYLGWMAQRTQLPTDGNFTFEGRVIGPHEGICRYTVGQRRPGLIRERKVYISKIDGESHNIELCFWDDLFKTEVNAHSFNWIIDEPEEPICGTVRVRHTKWENPACIIHPGGDKVRIICEEPVRAPAAGQSAVVYQGDMLLGGGFIY